MASYLILHGYEGSGPDHWQTWLADRLRYGDDTVAYPELPAPYAPNLQTWRTALEEALRELPGKPVVVCHSLACLLWLHHSAQPVLEGGLAERVLLVAPPSTAGAPREILNFFPVPFERERVAGAARVTRLVCAHDDPFCPEGADNEYGDPLGLECDVLDGAGHINPESGYGQWPAVEAWCRGEATAVTAVEASA